MSYAAPPDHPSRLAALAAMKRLKAAKPANKATLAVQYAKLHPGARKAEIESLFGASGYIMLQSWLRGEWQVEERPPCECATCARARGETVDPRRP